MHHQERALYCFRFAISVARTSCCHVGAEGVPEPLLLVGQLVGRTATHEITGGASPRCYPSQHDPCSSAREHFGCEGHHAGRDPALSASASSWWRSRARGAGIWIGEENWRGQWRRTLVGSPLRRPTRGQASSTERRTSYNRCTHAPAWVRGSWGRCSSP